MDDAQERHVLHLERKVRKLRAKAELARLREAKAAEHRTYIDSL